jgi:integrase
MPAGTLPMPQQIKAPKIARRTNRLTLPIQKKAYFVTIDRGLALGYRRTQTAGTWVMRCTSDGQDWTQAIAKADDHEESDGKDILTFGEAQTRARELIKKGKPGATGTLDDALNHYQNALANRESSLYGVSCARLHLAPTRLLQKLISKLDSDELQAWRDSLKSKMKPSSINRIMNTVRACLNMVAPGDPRWRIGCSHIEDANVARNIILTKDQVRAIIGAAYRDSQQLGEFIEILAVTGCRPIQAQRLQGEDVQPDFLAGNKKTPRLMMPSSRKGKAKRTILRRPVPISESLAKRLSGRTGQLLLRPDGRAWDAENLPRRFELLTKGMSLPAGASMYSLRHSSIVRQLLAGVPIRVVAALHDTSVQMIERNYSEHIADHADELARQTLLETMAEVIMLPPASTKARAKKGVPEVPG